MKEIVVASTNQGKLKEIKAMLEGIGIQVIPMNEALNESIEIEETGTTFKENAKLKAETICQMIGKPTLADDSGLEVDAMDKAPGVYSSRFMGETTSYDIKNQHIIDQVEGKERTARFICAMALAIPHQETILIEESFEGEIHHCIEGGNGFGYDPIFFVPELNKTSASLSLEEKNKYSHRAKALRKLYDMLKEL